VRLARRAGSSRAEDKEHFWLPRLAPQLPLAIPVPVARGRPGAGYPWFWSVVTWLPGETPVGDPVRADELAGFIAALQGIDASGAPEPGAQRGLPLSTRAPRVEAALRRIDAPGAAGLWERAVRVPECRRAPVWLHADLDARNVLVEHGRLTGVIDWGCLGAGDPAVEVMSAWKLLGRDERDRFRALLAVDDATWLRAEGWALSQALIALDYYTLETYPLLVREAERWLFEVLAS